MKHHKISFHKILIILFGFLSILNLINCCFFHFSNIYMTENQILYIYSSLAQVIGALLGLTIAGYSVIDSKIQSIGATDDTITEYTESLRSDCFHSLIYIIIFSVIDIIFCLITLAIYNEDNAFFLLLTFFLTEAILLFLLIMTEVIKFALYLNPTSIKEKSMKEKYIIDNEYSSNKENKNSFSSFITYYNLLEELLKQYACELTCSPQSMHNLHIFDALNILQQNQIINGRAYYLINDLRRYRNALVHSPDIDKSVNTVIYNELKDIYTLIHDIYMFKDNNDIKLQKINKLYDYTNRNHNNELDQRLLSYLKKHPSASLSELSKTFNYTKSGILKKLKLLQESGLIQQQESNGRRKWYVNDTNS